MALTPKSKIHLVLRNTDALSGTPRILRRQAQLLQDHGQVSVISENFHAELKENNKIQCQRVFKWPSNGLFQRRFFDWQVQRKINQTGSDLVIGNGETLVQDLLFMHVCVHKGAELYPEKYKKNLSVPFHRMIFEQGRFKTLICVSKMMRDDLVKRFDIKAPTYVLYPGFDPDIKKKINNEVVNEIRNKVTKGQQKIVLGVITSGDLLNRGAFALIRAVAKLPLESRQKVSMLIVGKEGHPEKLYNLAQELGIGEQVTWMSPREDVANLFLATDIIVHAAQMEAFGMSVLEAMALQKPIITTQTVGCSELFPLIQQDFIIPNPSPDLLAHKLDHLIQNPDLWKKMGDQNSEIAQKHSWDYFDQGFMKVINTEFPKIRP